MTRLDIHIEATSREQVRNLLEDVSYALDDEPRSTSGCGGSDDGGHFTFTIRDEPVTLVIQLVSKPEMTVQEATAFIDEHFPEPFASIISSNPETGIVRVKMLHHALTEHQRDWLHMSPFAARYIDSYTAEKEN